jgi:hypothetical protein
LELEEFAMPKSISGSVGKGGKNRFEDVLIIQYLLNCVPASKGGPSKELVLDALCGNLTNAAIIKFQQAALGFADGRVDAGGQTLNTLLCYDPYPSMKLTLPSVDNSGKGSGKKGGSPMNNSWDPFGYYNPASPNYMKSGYEPPPFEGKQENEIKNSVGQKDGGQGWKWGPGQQGQKDGGQGWKTGQGQQGQKDGGQGWKTGQGQQGGIKSGGYDGYGGKGAPGSKQGQKVGGGGGGIPWPSSPKNQPSVIIGDNQKTGSPPEGNVKGSQNQGGIVGKV